MTESRQFWNLEQVFNSLHVIHAFVKIYNVKMQDYLQQADAQVAWISVAWEASRASFLLLNLDKIS